MKKTGISLAAAALVASAPALAQSSDDLKLLRDQIQQLQNRIMQIEQEKSKPQQVSQPTQQPPQQAAVTGGDFPGSFKLPGTNTSIGIGGYVKASAIRSSRSPLAYSQSDELLAVTTIPLSTTPAASLRTDNFKIAAKESRLLLRTSTPSSYGLVTTMVEGDFFGPGGTETSTNGHGFRMRYAWGTIGNFGAGQFVSNALNVYAVPETVDFSAQIGIFGGMRVPVIRWQQPFAGGFWSVSVENPESLVVLNSTNNGANTAPDTDKYPDLTAKVNFNLGKGNYELAGMARKITSAPGPTQQSKWGYGLSFSGYLPTVGKSRFMFGVNGSKDMGRQLAGLVSDAVMVGNNLDGIDTFAGFLSYKHYWTENLRSNLAVSWIDAKNPGGLSAGTAGGLNKKFRTAHLNLIWAVTPTSEIGAEFLRATREVESGVRGDLNRWLLMAKYMF